jgi:hypothetical protein
MPSIAVREDEGREGVFSRAKAGGVACVPMASVFDQGARGRNIRDVQPRLSRDIGTTLFCLLGV